ncbi:hypothetical protein EVA_21099, partial [gut metagenome]
DFVGDEALNKPLQLFRLKP